MSSSVCCKIERQSSRVGYIDVAKGIGIIAVIIGHMNIWKLNHLIYSFHMPLFFLISGYFISSKYSNKEFICKKAKTLLVPYLFTWLAMIAFSVLKDLVKGENADTVFSDLIKWVVAGLYGSGNIEVGGGWSVTRIGAIWFLLAMFFSCVIVRFIIGKKYAWLCVLFVSLIGYVSAFFVWLPLSIQAGMCSSFFVYIGYEERQHQILKKYATKIVLALFFVIWILAVIFGEINMSKNYYKLLPLSVLGAIFGSYLILFFCYKLESFKKLRFISQIAEFYGRNSLIVLCFHLLELSFFPWSTFKIIASTIGFSSIMIIAIQFILKMTWVTLAVVIVRRCRLLDNIFSGRILNEK